MAVQTPPTVAERQRVERLGASMNLGGVVLVLHSGLHCHGSRALRLGPRRPEYDQVNVNPRA